MSVSDSKSESELRVVLVPEETLTMSVPRTSPDKEVIRLDIYCIYNRF